MRFHATDPEQHILYINPAFTEQTGYTSTEVLGQTVCSLNILRDFELLHIHYADPGTRKALARGIIRVTQRWAGFYDAALTITPV